ncbi:sestrin homolog [Tribolium castaneum]|uniref:sestrin homolog n=1 Tax=Tribolium castaneum TaxID=7070 RepID=UPI0030FE6575
MFVQTEFNKSNNNNELSRSREVDSDSYDGLFKDLDLISRFCMPICSRDNEIREVALDVISKTVEGWLDGVGSPKHYRMAQPERRRLQNASNGCAYSDIVGNTVNDVPKEYLDLVSLHLPIILRLSISCPFINVREKCQHILEIVQSRGLPIPYPVISGPSAYIDPEELPPLGTFNEKTNNLFVDAFLQSNRLDHVSQVMGYHTSYLDHFLKTQNFILRGDGPLPFHYRHYIAIMAAGRHQCGYLINLQKQEFLLLGGDHSWLKGLSSIPPKLKNLYDINKILAHRPWLLNTSHIEKLTKGKDSWSLAEVIHAIVILTHFHSLCSFVFACGVNQEVDQAGGFKYQMPGETRGSAHPSNTNQTNPKDIPTVDITEDWKNSSQVGPPSPTEPEVGINTIMQRMKTLSEQNEECTPVELAKRFENIETQSAELGLVGAERLETPADISCFIEDGKFGYQDFAKRDEQSDFPTFRVQDYSWNDHGYSLVNRLYNDVGNLLDDKFKTAQSLTYYTMGGRTDVDTSRFRRAIWNYIQCLLGIRHDDYDYGEINQLLERSLKTFIKSACCYPERVTKKDYDRVLREFKHSEKVHVNLMVLEARMQAELLYALRTVNRYMTN